MELCPLLQEKYSGVVSIIGRSLVGARPCLDQERHNLAVPVLASHVQRSRSIVGRGLVGVRPCLDQERHNLAVSLLRSEVQRSRFNFPSARR